MNPLQWLGNTKCSRISTDVQASGKHTPQEANHYQSRTINQCCKEDI